MEKIGKEEKRTKKNWDATREEMDLVDQIIIRAHGLIALDAEESLSLRMDIIATHLNGCPLRLLELLIADEDDFLNDVVGIGNNMDRNTGTLANGFLPKFRESFQ